MLWWRSKIEIGTETNPRRHGGIASGGPNLSGTQTGAHRSNPRSYRQSANRRIRLDRWFRKYALLPIAIIGGAWLFWDNRAAIDDAASGVALRLPAPSSSTPARQALPAPAVVADPKIVHLNARPGLDVPVRRVTRWTITDARFGQIEVYVPVGKTPREAFTVALAERGYQVVR